MLGNLAAAVSKRPIAVLMLLLLTVVLGFIALTRMNVDILPNIEFPYAIVMASYMGGGALEVEELVVKPIEDMVSMVSGVKRYYSTSYDGMGLVFVEFELDVPPSDAVMRLERAVEAASAFLPEGVKTSVFELDPSVIPVYVFLTTDDEERVANLVRRVEGVANVEVVGTSKKYVRISLDPDKLKRYELNPAVVEYFLGGGSVYPFGTVESEKGEVYQVSIDGRFENMNDLLSVIVGFRGMKSMNVPSVGKAAPAFMVPVRLKNVAKVEVVQEEVRGEVRANGEPGVILIVRKQPTANTVDVVNRIKKVLNENGVAYSELINQARFTERTIRNLVKNLLIGATVASIVVLLFLRSVVSMLVVVFAIPISFMITIVVLYFSGLSLDTLTLGGLATAVGMLVDNAIVVFENTYRHLSMRKKYHDAARWGVGEVFGAIFASTVTTVVVFVPFLFTSSIGAVMFRYFALSFSLSLFASLGVAVLIIPAGSRWVKTREWIGFERFKEMYVRSLDAVLNRKKMVGLVTLLLLIPAALYVVYSPMDFMPDFETDLLTLDFVAPSQYSYKMVGDLLKPLEEVVLAHKEELGIDSVFSTVGVVSTYSRIFGRTENSARMEIKFAGPYRTVAQRKDRLLGLIKSVLPDSLEMKVSRSGEEMSQFLGQPVQITVYAQDLKELENVSKRLKERISRIDGVERVETSFDSMTSVVKVKINRNAAAVNAMLPAMVFQQLQPYTMGKPLGNIEMDGEIYPVKLFYGASAPSLESLSRLVLTNFMGGDVYLGMVGTFGILRIPPGIEHYMGRRVAYVNVTEISGSIGRVSRSVTEIMEREFPDLEYELGGQLSSLEETVSDLKLTIFVGVLLVFMVLAAQFESLLRPFVVFMVIPFILVGVAFTLLIFRIPLNVPVLVAALALAGVVVNNAIVMITMMIQLKGSGSMRETVLKAASIRLRPVLMTTLTTVAGLIPLAVERGEGSEIERPIALTMIFGLLITMLFTLFLIPMLFELFERKRES